MRRGGSVKRSALWISFKLAATQGPTLRSGELLSGNVFHDEI